MGEREIRNHVDNHFGNLFGVKGDHPIHLGNTLWEIQSDLVRLDSTFKEEEVKKAEWDLLPEKAPRSDSFPILFLGGYSQ